MTLRIFLKRRRQFNELLASNSNLSFNRYMRLMALCSVDILCTIPLVIFLIVFDCTENPRYVWRGLADLHLGFSRVGQWPALLWTAPSGSIWINTCQNWFTIIYGILFFCWFGLAEEARTHYRSAFTTIAKKLGYSTAGSSLDSSTGFPYVILTRGNSFIEAYILSLEEARAPSSVLLSQASSSEARTDGLSRRSQTRSRLATSIHSTTWRRTRTLLQTPSLPPVHPSSPLLTAFVFTSNKR